MVPSAACILGASFWGTTVETAVFPSLARIRHRGADPSGFSFPFLLGFGTSVEGRNDKDRRDIVMGGGRGGGARDALTRKGCRVRDLQRSPDGDGRLGLEEAACMIGIAGLRKLRVVL